MKKDTAPKVCEWCGTRLRGQKTACPRGPFCAVEQANHEALMARIDDERAKDKTIRRVASRG